MDFHGLDSNYGDAEVKENGWHPMIPQIFVLTRIPEAEIF